MNKARRHRTDCEKSNRHSGDLSVTPPPIISPPSRPSSIDSLSSNGYMFLPSTTPPKDTLLDGVSTNGKQRPTSIVVFTPSTASSEEPSPVTNGMQNTSQQVTRRQVPAPLPIGSHHQDTTSVWLPQPEPSSAGHGLSCILQTSRANAEVAPTYLGDVDIQADATAGHSANPSVIPATLIPYSDTLCALGLKCLVLDFTITKCLAIAHGFHLYEIAS